MNMIKIITLIFCFLTNVQAVELKEFGVTADMEAATKTEFRQCQLYAENINELLLALPTYPQQYIGKLLETIDKFMCLLKKCEEENRQPSAKAKIGANVKLTPQ